MAIITRLSRLLRADFHALLDRMEEPDVLLRQALREMEEALDSDGQRERQLTLEIGQINARRNELARSCRSIVEELDICFESDQESLARALIKRHLEAERMDELLTRKAAALEKSRTELRTRLREQGEQLESLRQKVELLDEESLSAQAHESWRLPETSVREEDVEVAFLREKQRRAQA